MRPNLSLLAYPIRTICLVDPPEEGVPRSAAAVVRLSDLESNALRGRTGKKSEDGCRWRRIVGDSIPSGARPSYCMTVVDGGGKHHEADHLTQPGADRADLRLARRVGLGAAHGSPTRPRPGHSRLSVRPGASPVKD